MRVAQVCPYSLTIPGGVQGQVLGLARALRSQGHQVRVMAPCDGPPPDGGVAPLGRSIPLAGNGSVAPLAPDLPCALRTIRTLRDEDFDVVHLHEPLAPGPSLTTLLYSDRPMVGTFHRSGASLAYSVLRPLVRTAGGYLAWRCAVSADAQATAQAALGGVYEPVFNGIETERFAKATAWPTAGPTIVFIGRHEPRKGVETLLAAFSRLPPDTRLWMVGEGPQTAELRQRTVEDTRIEWLGRIGDSEVASRLRGAEVFCAPSLHGESFGVVLLEAMAAHTAIVASDLPAYRKVTGNGRDAMLVPPGDVDALADALRRALEDRGLGERLAVAGEARAGDFAMDRLAERYVEIYTHIVRQPRPADARGRRYGGRPMPGR